MTHVATQLDYAPRPTPVRGTWSRRVAVMVGAFLLIAGVASVTPRAARHAQVVYWQGQCLNYTAPADQVVYTNDPAQLPVLLAPGSGYGGSLATQEVHFIPPAYRNLAGNFATSFTSGTAFLHRRTSARGNVRLVAVSLRRRGVGENGTMAVAARVFEPGGIVRGPAPGPDVTELRSRVVFLFPGDTCTVFAGQPDPADESHFTIDYVHNGTRHTLDGWLKDDGSVMIENREQRPTMTEPSAHLDYSPMTDAPRAARVRRWVKLAIPALLIVAAALLVPRYVRHASVLLAQRTLSAHAAPSTQVVYENDPAEVKKLLAAQAGYASDPAQTQAFLIKADWMNFYAARGGGYQSWGTVYLGELQTRDGRRVLCSLDLSVSSLGKQQWASMGARMIEPGTTYRSPRPVSPCATRGDGSSIAMTPGDTLRVYAGQRDPNDASHVTIDYVLNDTTHTIDGWLEDTGFMRLELRE